MDKILEAKKKEKQSKQIRQTTNTIVGKQVLSPSDLGTTDIITISTGQTPLIYNKLGKVDERKRMLDNADHMMNSHLKEDRNESLSNDLSLNVTPREPGIPYLK